MFRSLSPSKGSQSLLSLFLLRDGALSLPLPVGDCSLSLPRRDFSLSLPRRDFSLSLARWFLSLKQKFLSRARRVFCSFLARLLARLLAPGTSPRLGASLMLNLSFPWQSLLYRSRKYSLGNDLLWFGFLIALALPALASTPWSLSFKLNELPLTIKTQQHTDFLLKLM